MPECDAKIRPLPNDTEIGCEKTGEHSEHQGTLRDYAFPGSATMVSWLENDRRTFRGEWSQCRKTFGCVLPTGHQGMCAQ